MPDDLLRLEAVSEVSDLSEWHWQLKESLRVASESARRAIASAHEAQARQCARKVRNVRPFEIGDWVWLLRPPRGSGMTKLAHRWQGPAAIVASTGYDN